MPSRAAIVISIAVGVLLAVFGPEVAGAAEVRSQQASPGGADWWTPERMKRAQDLTPPEPQAAATSSAAQAAASRRGPELTVPQAAAGSDAPFRMHRRASAVGSGAIPLADGDFKSGVVEDPAAAGVRMHGRVFFEVPGVGPASCSGTAINSNRRNMFLTAGHCVHNGGYQGPWFDRVIFVPAYENGEAPFGIWEAKRLYATGIWTEFGHPNADISVVSTRRSKLGKLQDVVGARGITFNRPVRQKYTSYGYPAEAPFDGESERFCTSQFVQLDENSKVFLGPPTMQIGCDMNGGSSGGSWVIKDRLAASLNSYLYEEQDGAIFGPQFGGLARDIYTAGLATCRGKVATHVGGNGADRIVGTGKRDVIVGGDGADKLIGKGGNDLICGGAGNDKLTGDAGKDELIGQSGKDRLHGGSGKDQCKGGSGKNRASGCEKKRGI